MHRLRQFREHEVCDINNAANRIESDRLQACLQPKGRSCTAHVLDHKRAVTTAETEILNVHLQWRWPFRQKRELHWIAQTQADDGAYFTRHAEVSPEIRTMRKALIVDLDHPIRPEPVELLARRSLVQKQQTGMITADPKLSCAREHAFALNAVDHDSADVLFAERRAGRHPGYQ